MRKLKLKAGDTFGDDPISPVNWLVGSVFDGEILLFQITHPDETVSDLIEAAAASKQASRLNIRRNLDRNRGSSHN